MTQPTPEQIKAALDDLEKAYAVNKNNRYSFHILDLWGLDSRTDEAIIAIGLAAGKHYETIRALLSPSPAQKDPNP